MRLSSPAYTKIGVGEDAVVDAPKLDSVFSRHQELGCKAEILFQHKTPGSLGFNYMCVGIDDTHKFLPETVFLARPKGREFHPPGSF
jgi:hypothetical protein